uniref:Uncharacterized protein n=1 Tax=Erwinia amylovora ATCC BAA-2158 TaxID=889211 RepID=E5B4N1_ERWAM|nr:hypothetical protein predicted by Glimmer/Critica [Erwinia amylovora ATCC BAA-2158]
MISPDALNLKPPSLDEIFDDNLSIFEQLYWLKL